MGWISSLEKRNKKCFQNSVGLNDGLTVNIRLERASNYCLKYFPNIFLEQRRKTTKTLSNYSQSPTRDLNLGSPRHKEAFYIRFSGDLFEIFHVEDQESDR
jgi:hypothetical protein